MTTSAVSRRTIIAGAAALLAVPRDAAARVLRLPSELAAQTLALPGRITLGPANADVTLVEFFDYNCPFCKNAAADIRPLMKAEPKLRYVLVNYAVLGAASIEASRVALAHSMQRTPGGYLALHEGLFKLRGRVDAARAVQLAVELGADRQKLIADADSDRVTSALTDAAKLGDTLGLVATPSFVAGREAVIGYLDVPQKRKAIANLRRCESLGC
ncbi:MAG: DsbA family protein [Beijerinckiaceae bacterium]